MNKITGILALLSILLGGMLGYSYAYGKILQQIKNEQPPQAPPIPTQKTAPLPTGTASFQTIIEQSSGQRVLPLDSVCKPVLDAIEQAASATIEKFNRPTSPLIGMPRINEASRHFEDSLLEHLDAQPDLSCQIPHTREGKAQRSGYPDLMILHQPTGRTYYLDPKLYEAQSQSSSLRTFYYTPRQKTSKILKPAHHLLIGFAHDGKDGQWTFLSWSLVDLSQTTLTLKSEYNASNRDLYQESTIVRQSHKRPPLTLEP